MSISSTNGFICRNSVRMSLPSLLLLVDRVVDVAAAEAATFKLSVIVRWTQTQSHTAEESMWIRWELFEWIAEQQMPANWRQLFHSIAFIQVAVNSLLLTCVWLLPDECVAFTEPVRCCCGCPAVMLHFCTFAACTFRWCEFQHSLRALLPIWHF